MGAGVARLARAPALVALVALALAPTAGAEVSPELRDVLARTAAGKPVAVIVTLAQQVDPAAYAGQPAALLEAERRLADGTQPPVIAAAGLPARRFWVTNAVALAAPRVTIERLAAMGAVGRIDADPLVRAGDALSTPPPDAEGASGIAAASVPGVGDAKPLDLIRARAVWSNFGVTGTGVRVGSIDSGVDPDNPDLAGKIVAWRDFVGNRSSPYDDSGHGTHTIGTMVGGSVQGAPIGVAPGARVLVAKALDENAAGQGATLLAAGQWMTDPDGNPATNDFPAVVCNSWTAGDANDPWFDQVVRTWLAIGIVPVFAAGNTGPGASTIGSPGSYPSSLSVAAVDDSPTVAGFSSRGPVTWDNRDRTGPAAGTVLIKPDIAAPGVGIVSTLGTGYGTYSGTSMAAPHVAGVAALMKQANPGLGAPEITQIMRDTATDLGPGGTDSMTGSGLVNALAAVATAMGRPVPATIVPPAAIPSRPAGTTPPATGAAPRAPSLSAISAARRISRGRGALVVRGRLSGRGRLVAALRPIGLRGAGAGLTVARSLARGAFRLVVPVRLTAPGRYRLTLTPASTSGRPVGRAVVRTIQVIN
jgi:subtilisin family serine protease